MSLDVLSRLGYAFEARGEPFLDLDDVRVLGRVIETGATLNAIHPEASELNLLTSISGFDYAALSEDARTFEISGAQVRVGSLEKLLRSKESSGRPMDVEFLRAFRARSENRGDE